MKEIQTNSEFVKNIQNNKKTVKNRKGIEYYQLECGFDIETTSFYENNKKRAIMYIWQLKIGNDVTIGRDWFSFVSTIKEISKNFQLSDKKRLVIYVHNLSFEFQFMRKWFNWIEVFCIENRKPVKALCDNGIEFRCSYLLSGYGLETLSKNIDTKHKEVGNLDYNLIRHSKTVLTDKELSYCITDVCIVTDYIKGLLKEWKIYDLPLTKTGFIRKDCRRHCLTKNGKKNYDYVDKMKEQTLTKDHYIFAKQAFSGGFTHSNPNHTDKVIKDVVSYDICSAYPYAMITGKFPNSKGCTFVPNSEDELQNICKKYCVLIDITYMELLSKNTNEFYISKSRLLTSNIVSECNGRVVAAKKARLIITDIDYEIINEMYSYSSCEIGICFAFKRDYLPKEFIEYVLRQYETKTKLKDVFGKEKEYLNAKENLNSLYGMAVTDIVRPLIGYDNKEFTEQSTDLDSAISDYNESKKRFLNYLWGVWTVAYTRKRLMELISLVGINYVYSDTDSVKFKDFKDSIEIIEKLNKNIENELIKISKHHKIDLEKFMPTTINGVTKKIGIWELDGKYSRFKTLGAKRYLVEQNGKFKMTVAGLGKKVINWLSDSYDDVFEMFTDNMRVPAQHTGKLTKTYIDYEISGYITDYQGNSAYYEEKSGVHLEPAPYSLNLSEIFIKYLKSINCK